MLSVRSFALGSLAASALVADVLAEPKVLHMPIARKPNAGRLTKRSTSGTALVTANNALSESLYYVNATVGTPGQLVQLDIDTGSSDVWFFGPNSCDTKTVECVGGTFDPSKSSSLQSAQNLGTFSIQYGTPGSNVTGNYIQDAFSVGEAKVQNLTMAVATYAAFVPTGIMGIGFDTNEAITEFNHAPYPNFIDVLVSQNVISTKAYSLWLNDLEASSGSCLFGGYDTKKFSGDLLTVDIQPDAQSGSLTSMTVAWTGFSLTSGSSSKQLHSKAFPSPALLDSGTSLSIIPDDVFYPLVKYFEAEIDQAGDVIVNCDLLNHASGTLDFQFGGSNGPTIKVPFSEFAVPAYDTNGNLITFNNGTAACLLGLTGDGSETSGPGQASPIILGDTFLRSAYVVYDLSQKQISLAQTVFNATDSNVVEITPNKTIASVVTGVTASQTATGNPDKFGSATAPATSAVATDLLGGNTGLGVLTQASATGSATGSGSSPTGSSSSHKSQAQSQSVPNFMSTALIAGGSMLLGSVFFVLH